MKERTYICCDLKSFYASVECVERGLDPMTTNLVVADKLPGRLPLSESLRYLWPGPAVRGGTAGGRGKRQAEMGRSRPSAHRRLLERS